MICQNKNIVAITGGIGSGKSVVCRILAAMGYDIYDCDTRAKFIMDRDTSIHDYIANEVCSDAIKNGIIDRRILSKAVFNDSELLKKLNAIVHGRVLEDIGRWSKDKKLCFIETAILYQSGLDRHVTEVWEVKAPEQLRMTRVMKRSALTESEVRQRIKCQDSYKVSVYHHRLYQIINDDIIPVLPQIESLLLEI